MDPEHASSPVVPNLPSESDSSSSEGETAPMTVTEKKKNKKRWGLFGRRSSKKVKKANKILIPVNGDPGNSDPDDVLEVWFAGCHSGVYFHPVIYVISPSEH